MPGPLIALTTDFGWGSSYVAQLKGVLLSALPEARIVDVAHDLPAQSLWDAELLMRGVAFAFPLGTTHVVVIDPGVGTDRRPIAIEARGMRFVGPDNGILAFAMAQPGARAVVLDRTELFVQPLSRTFHGRDLFAPVAAELAGGLDLEAIGSPIDDLVPSNLPAPRIEEGRVTGETLGADRFGNLLTNIAATSVPHDWTVRVDGTVRCRRPTYGAGEVGELMVLEGSDGFLEVALRDGSAAKSIGRVAGVAVQCSCEVRGEPGRGSR